MHAHIKRQISVRCFSQKDLHSNMPEDSQFDEFFEWYSPCDVPIDTLRVIEINILNHSHYGIGNLECMLGGNGGGPKTAV